jgi:hypothetical protein
MTSSPGERAWGFDESPTMKQSIQPVGEWKRHDSAGPACDPALLAYFSVSGTRVVPAGAVATGLECDAFRRWIDGLQEEGNEALVQVRQWGFTYDLSALQVQLRRALEANPPEGLAGWGVGRRLLELLARLQGAVCFLLEEKRPV